MINNEDDIIDCIVSHYIPAPGLFDLRPGMPGYKGDGDASVTVFVPINSSPETQDF